MDKDLVSPNETDGQYRYCRLDYHGDLVYPIQFYAYADCSICGALVWHKHMFLGKCPLCILHGGELVVVIGFGKSRSKNYVDAVRLYENMGGHVDSDRHLLRYTCIGDFLGDAEKINSLIQIIFKWKSFSASVNGESCTAAFVSVLLWEIDRLKRETGSVDIVNAKGAVVLTANHGLQ